MITDENARFFEATGRTSTAQLGCAYKGKFIRARGGDVVYYVRQKADGRCVKTHWANQTADADLAWNSAEQINPETFGRIPTVTGTPVATSNGGVEVSATTGGKNMGKIALIVGVLAVVGFGIAYFVRKRRK